MAIGISGNLVGETGAERISYRLVMTWILKWVLYYDICLYRLAANKTAHSVSNVL